MAKKQKPILKASDIQAKWAAEAKGQVWSPTDTITALGAQNDELVTQNSKYEKQITELMKRLEARQSSVSNLRDLLDTIMKEYGIKAAFEPLIKMACEKYSDDHVNAALAGQYVLNNDQRIKIWTEILSYQIPKLKAIEMSGQTDQTVTVIVRRFGDGSQQPVMRNVTPQAAPVVVDEAASAASDVKIRRF